MGRLKELAGRYGLTLAFSLAVFLVMLVTMLVVVGAALLLSRLGLPVLGEGGRVPLLAFSLCCLAVGAVFALLFSRLPLRPVRAVCEAADRIAGGDYSARIDIARPEAFARLGRSFNHMAEELDSVEMLRSDFVNTFSHEFRTPIVSIRGFARMLARDDLTPQERDECLEAIVTQSERLCDLSTSVLDLSRLERQAILTRRTRVNVSEQLRQAIALMYGKWADKGVGFAFDCGERHVEGDAALLSQLWTNLLDNAAKFSPPGATVEVRVTRRTDALEVEVADHGCGMDERQVRHAFDKFYQADTSHAAQGVGLGLAIAARIVELHGGTIGIESRQGAGTRMTVTLPA